MKRLLTVLAVVGALAMVVGVGVAAAAGPGYHGGMAAVTATGDYPLYLQDQLRTQDRLYINQANVTGTSTVPGAMRGAIAWLPDGATIDSVTRDVQVDGSTKTVTVTFHLTLADGTTSDVQRVHVFTLQSDGTWLLTSAPDCPYR
ncbi:MAG TPA: hypothetical protein VFN57_18230 [Thermomicrobiaceae bacterium]|nr:hypothetical protein [Thermomicrobiaceae bacterium]